MAKKDYSKRQKERWLRKQRKDKLAIRESMNQLSNMRKTASLTGRIFPMILNRELL